MFKLILISTLIVAACCMPAEKSENLEPSETQWNSAWGNPAASPNAAWGGNSWNRWNNPAAVDPRLNRWNNPAVADPRLNRWGAEPWNRQWGANAGWNQWNRAGAGAWPAAGAPAAAAVANRGWNTW